MLRDETPSLQKFYKSRQFLGNYWRNAGRCRSDPDWERLPRGVQGNRLVNSKFDDDVPRGEPASGTAGGKSALVDRIEWNILPDSSTAMAAIQTGEADWYECATVELLPTVAKNKSVVTRTLDPIGYPHPDASQSTPAALQQC